VPATQLGLDGKVCPPGPIPRGCAPRGVLRFFAGILPEGKYNLVKAFQKSGDIVGVCSDGANDAPALRQAQMGIAVSTATDVAKSAACLVLTKPGLGGIVASVKEGRVTFQRIFTYALNSVTKKVCAGAVSGTGAGPDRTRDPDSDVMVIIMLTRDLLGMSLTTDNVRPSPMPTLANRRIDDRWRLHGSFPNCSFAPPSWPSPNLVWVLKSKRCRPWPSWRSCSAIKPRPMRIRAPAYLVLLSKPMAHRFVGGGSC